MIDSIDIYRPYLVKVAYNILGEVQEAEDIVQEAFALFLTLKEGHVKNKKSYLTRMVANKSIDRLKSLQKQRESYPGTWLPEPFFQPAFDSQNREEDIMSFEVICAMESLNPIERAVFVLREAFDFPFAELAHICSTTESNCRKILSRTRKKMANFDHKNSPSRKQPDSFMQTFLQAIADEDSAKLASLLKENVMLYSDGGGKASAAVHPLSGREVVSKFLIGIGKKRKDVSFTIRFIKVNQQSAVLLSTPAGPDSLIILAGDHQYVRQIFIIRNPDKLFLR